MTCIEVSYFHWENIRSIQSFWWQLVSKTLFNFFKLRSYPQRYTRCERCILSREVLYYFYVRLVHDMDTNISLMHNCFNNFNNNHILTSSYEDFNSNSPTSEEADQIVPDCSAITSSYENIGVSALFPNNSNIWSNNSEQELLVKCWTIYFTIRCILIDSQYINNI